MRILMVTPYPPTRDGIAAYAVQSVRALRAAGHQVEVLSPGPSAAHHHLDLVGPRGALALARRVRDYHRVIVQFHPDFFYRPGASAWQRALEGLALTAAFGRARSVEVVVHEVDGRHGRRTTLHGQVTRRMWRSVDLVRVHTERDRQNFSRDFGVPRARIQVIDHGAHFVACTGHDRASARASLHVPPGAFVFLSIGFIQPHKGFDRAVRAFADLGVRHGRLDVVGSVRVEEPAYLAHRDELAALVDATQGAYLHDGFVSDELFDRWIVASDVVVLPYRSIWSSGVLERARLFGRPVIATAVGGLPEQATAAGVVLVSDEVELRQAMRAAAGLGADRAVRSRPWPGPDTGSGTGPDTDLRARVQEEVVARAAAERGYRRPATRADGQPTLGRRLGRRSGRDVGSQVGPAAASAAVRRMRSLEMPATTSSRPLARLAKRVVRRLTAWEVEPVVHQLNTLRMAVAEAVEAVVADRTDHSWGINRVNRINQIDRTDQIGGSGGAGHRTDLTGHPDDPGHTAPSGPEEQTRPVVPGPTRGPAGGTVEGPVGGPG